VFQAVKAPASDTAKKAAEEDQLITWRFSEPLSQQQHKIADY
jgi:hypothetical protein